MKLSGIGSLSGTWPGLAREALVAASQTTAAGTAPVPFSCGACGSRGRVSIGILPVVAAKELSWLTESGCGSRRVPTGPAALAGASSEAAACRGIVDTVEKGTLDAAALSPTTFGVVSETLDSLGLPRGSARAPAIGFPSPMCAGAVARIAAS